MDDNKWLIKQTYEYKWYFNQMMCLSVIWLLVFFPMCIYALRSQAFDSVGILYMVILYGFFFGGIIFSIYKLKAFLRCSDTYSRLNAKVVKIRHFGKRWYLTLRITKEDGTEFEEDTEKVFSYFAAKSKLDKTVSVLYDPVDGRLAVIKTDI